MWPVLWNTHPFSENSRETGDQTKPSSISIAHPNNFSQIIHYDAMEPQSGGGWISFTFFSAIFQLNKAHRQVSIPASDVCLFSTILSAELSGVLLALVLILPLDASWSMAI